MVDCCLRKNYPQLENSAPASGGGRMLGRQTRCGADGLVTQGIWKV